MNISYDPGTITSNRVKAFVQELHDEQTSLERKHEIMNILIDIIQHENNTRDTSRRQVRHICLSAFAKVRDFMTVDIMTRLLDLKSEIPSATLSYLCNRANTSFNFMFWEVCYENDFPTARKYLMKRFHANKTVYTEFARWFDKKYNLDIKLKHMPLDMTLSLFGWTEYS
jgi:hypothetical protein